MPPGRRGVRGLHHPVHHGGAGGRHAHLRGPCHRPGGQHRPDAGDPAFTVDTTPPDNQPPDTTITGGPAEGSTTNENAPTFGFTASEEGSTFQCRLDAAAFAACTTPFTTEALADGTHTFAVRAIDGAGNIDPTPATATFTVDTTPPDNQPPDTTITGGPAEGSTTNENAPTFGFTASEEGSTFQCRLDAAAFAACTTPFTTEALADGMHSFAVRAIDGAGNIDPTPATRVVHGRHHASRQPAAGHHHHRRPG